MASGLSEYVSKNGETVEEAANLFMGVASGAGHAGAKTGCYCFLKPCEGDLKRESQADVISVEESQAECGLALGYSRLYTRFGLQASAGMNACILSYSAADTVVHLLLARQSRGRGDAGLPRRSGRK